MLLQETVNLADIWSNQLRRRSLNSNKKMITMEGKGREIHRLLGKNNRRRSKGERERESVYFRKLKNLLYHYNFMSLLATKCTIYNSFFLLKILEFVPPSTWPLHLNIKTHNIDYNWNVQNAPFDLMVI
jgi:hypothetical protein